MSHTLSAVISFPAGTVVPKIEGCTVKKVFPAKTGDGQYGPWKLQGLVLADGGTEIRATAFDMDDLTYLQGKVVSLTSTGKNGKTGKPTGVSVEANKKDGTPEISIKGKQGGLIGNGQPNPAHIAGTPEHAATQTAPSAPSAPFKPVSQPQQGQGSDPVGTLDKMAVFWLGCWKKAGEVAGLPDDTKQAMTSSLFIEGCRNQLWRDWPAKVVPAPQPAAAEESDPF